VIDGPDSGKETLARSDTLTVGSAPGNDLVLTDETVSRYHLELRKVGDRVLVQDLGSTNGTEIGSVLVERGAIKPGSVVTIGKSALRLGDGGQVEVQLHPSEVIGRVRGRTSKMRQLLAKIARAGQSDVSVLILGETGTGKEVIARAIHSSGGRASHPFETVDCGALLPTLIASELFGHERGAFTGADRQHIGAFERADGGTIFLDEIGELPPALQASLLGVLERRRFRRLGGQKEIAVDVRVVAATNRDLRIEVNAGTFRQDLYFRLAIVSLKVPALRDRVDDIPLLIECFLQESGFDGTIADIFPPSTIDLLKAHHWPGNVRELRNVVEATLAMGEAPTFDGEDSDVVPNEDQPLFSGRLNDLLQRPYKDARGAVVDEFERLYVERLIARTHGNISKAARESKMNRNYLAQLLKEHKIVTAE
jgi:DNA-binding NtrC family response regulator